MSAHLCLLLTHEVLAVFHSLSSDCRGLEFSAGRYRFPLDIIEVLEAILRRYALGLLWLDAELGIFPEWIFLRRNGGGFDQLIGLLNLRFGLVQRHCRLFLPLGRIVVSFSIRLNLGR